MSLAVKNAFSKVVRATRQQIDQLQSQLLIWSQNLLSNQLSFTDNRKLASANDGFDQLNEWDKCCDSIFNCATIHDLNDDCLIEILLYLPIADRIRAERVCTRWQAASLESWKVIASLDLKRNTWRLLLNNYDNTKIATVDPGSLKKVLIRSGRFLKELNLMQWPQPLGDETLETISELCPDIQSLCLYNMNISSTGIISLKNKCRNLRQFQFTPLSDSFENNLSELFDVNKKLKILHIDENFSTRRISGRCIQSLPINTIEEIRMFNTHGLNARYLENTLKKCKNLRILAINGILDLPASTIEVIGEIITIKNLELKDEEADVSPSVMICLASLVNLEKLCLDRNPSVTDELLIQISINCKEIKILSVSGCDMVTNIGVSSLIMLPKLEELNICGVGKMTNEPRLFEFLGGYQASKLDSSNLLGVKQHLVDFSAADSSMNNDMIMKMKKIVERRTNNTTLRIHVDLTELQIPEELMTLPFLEIIDGE